MIQKVAKLRRYLLKSLPEKEMKEIELSLLSNDSLSAKLTIAENELIENFLEKTLSQEDVELFNKNFLVSPRRKEKVLYVSTLINHSKSVSIKKNKSHEKLSEKEKESLSPQKSGWFLIPVFTLLIISVFLGFIWLILHNTSDSLTPLEKDYVQINKQKIDIKDQHGHKRLNLRMNAKRSKSEINSILRKDFTEKVLFNLEIPSETDVISSFKIELFKDAEVIFTQNQIPVYTNPNGKELIFFLPSKKFEKGKYTIKAINNSVHDFPLRFSFFVE